MNRKYACQETAVKERGFTLVETMISIMIVMVVVSLFFTASSFWMAHKPQTNSLSYEEFVLFMNQLQMEYRRSSGYWTDSGNNKLYFTRAEDGYTVHFEKYEDKIRRQVRGVGHEVYMQRVTDFKVYERDYGVEIEVSGSSGTWRKTLVHPSVASLVDAPQ